MIDPLERRLEDWMQGAGRFESTEVKALVDGTTLPVRRTGPAFRVPTVARLAVLAGLLIAVVIAIGLGASGIGPKPVPPDPRAYAGDPRLDRCSGTGGHVSHAFELAHASDFQRVFPAALRTPELERPDAAFVVVFTAQDGQSGDAGASGSSQPSDDEGRSICVIVGSGPDAELNLYTGVDLSGFSPELVRRFAPDPDATVAPESPTPAPSTFPQTTPMPGIDWGPLAVVPPSVGSAQARTEGRVQISRGCVVLDVNGTGTMLVWPADRTVWDASEQVIRFTGTDGTTVIVAGGDDAVLGGSGGSFEEDGTTFDAWRQEITWVAPPAASCGVEEYWFVGGDATSTPVDPESSMSERELYRDSLLDPTFDVLAALPGFQAGGLLPDKDEIVVYWHGEFGPEAQAAAAEAESRGVPVNVIYVPYSNDELRVIAGDLRAAIIAKGIDVQGYAIGDPVDEITMWGDGLQSPEGRVAAEDLAAELLPADLTFVIIEGPGKAVPMDSRHNDGGRPTGPS